MPKRKSKNSANYKKDKHLKKNYSKHKKKINKKFNSIEKENKDKNLGKINEDNISLISEANKNFENKSNTNNLNIKDIPEDLLNMYNIYESYEYDSNDSLEYKEEESIPEDIQSMIKNKTNKKVEIVEDKNNRNCSENHNYIKVEKMDINDESKNILDSKYIKDYYEYIFYKNRKFILDKNNINYQKNKKGIKYQIYKCQFWLKNEATYQKIKKFNNKNKNLKSEDAINGFCRGEIKYIIENNIYILINMHSNSCDKYNNDENKNLGNDEYHSWNEYKKILTKYLEGQKFIIKKEFVKYAIEEFNKNEYNFNFNLIRLNNFYYY